MTCTEKLSLGAYALGTLDPDDRARVESHLDRCPDCRQALVEFSGLPGLLARVPRAELTDEPVVATDVAFRRLLDTAAAQRRARRRRYLLAAAAAVIVALGAGAGLGVWVEAGGPGGSTATTVAASSGVVHARAAVSATDSGSKVQLWLNGVPAALKCRLVAVAVDGHRETASSWEATYDGEATVTGWVSIPRNNIQRLVIETFSGQTLVTMPLRA